MKTMKKLNTSIALSLMAAVIGTTTVYADSYLTCEDNKVYYKTYDDYGKEVRSFTVDVNCATTIKVHNSLNTESTSQLEPSGVVAFDTVAQNGDYLHGVGYTSPQVSSYLYFNQKSFNMSLPPKVMFILIGTSYIKIDVPGEYLGNSFKIEVNGQEYFGTFQEAKDWTKPVVL